MSIFRKYCFMLKTYKNTGPYSGGSNSVCQTGIEVIFVFLFVFRFSVLTSTPS